MTSRKKLPQNIQALIGEIGEKQVLLRLYLLVHENSWEVFHNLGEAGYDVLLLNATTGEKIRIEVKTRQKLYTTGKNIQRVIYDLSDGEYQASDFLIAYFLDLGNFYVVPKSELKPVSVNNLSRWRFTLSLNKQGAPHPRFDEFHNAWGNLHPDFSGEDRTASI